MATKRINLSFNDCIEQDAYVYNLINSKKHKTEYVIEAVMAYVSKNDRGRINREDIKDAVREVLSESSIIGKSNKDESKNQDIPNEVFDMFNNL